MLEYIKNIFTWNKKYIAIDFVSEYLDRNIVQKCGKTTIYASKSIEVIVKSYIFVRYNHINQDVDMNRTTFEKWLNGVILIHVMNIDGIHLCVENNDN